MAVTVAVVVLSTLVTLGWVWDISWQTTIGQTGFWTPPHVAVLLAGLGFGVLCVQTARSLSATATHAGSDRQQRERMSLFASGLILGICGVLVLLGAAFYDYWWHATQLPQMRVLIPPHFVSVGGIVAISASVLQRLYSPGNVFKQPPEGCYDWLASREPVAQPGYSILVYEIPEG